jgi:transposase InsO family protein
MCARLTSQEAKRTLQLAMRRARKLGMPTAGVTVRFDHGSPVTGEVFEAYVAQRKCFREYSAVGRPQGMGKVERFNRSEKEQALKWDDATQRAEIQVVCDSYRQHYKYKRPYQALARKTPASVARHLTPKVVPLS